MTDWPKMESMVMVSDGYFVSEEFKSFPESVKKDALEHLRGVPVKIVGLALYSDNQRLCDVSVNDAWMFRISIEYVEYLVADTFGKNIELTPKQAEAIQPAKAVAVEEKAVTVSFPFTDDSRADDALLFFARNGYKAWMEDFSYLRGGKLNVEMPKGRT